MLLYDEINRKGFEGDTLLEGYSEFVRNLLVSKDTKAAILLEVADDFKQKYLQAAQQISTGWLIAALNLLNEAEINYKQARNKRLHVELAIIKLCYLLQAVEMVNNDGTVSKKKVVEAARPVAFKAIQPIRVKEQEPVVTTQPSIQKTSEVRLIIEEPEQRIEKKVVAETAPVNTEPKKSLGSLDAIRKKLSAQNKNGKEVKELTEEDLKVCWNQFIEKLVAKKNHSAVTNFKMAELKIIDNNSIEIITGNNIQQKFIEQERAELVDDLQQFFCNRQLTYNVIIVENEEQNQNFERPLNTKEQYQKIIEEYPLVKELKERLGLILG
jgi:DNA polymerase-3 subunit gamma/tau